MNFINNSKTIVLASLANLCMGQVCSMERDAGVHFGEIRIYEDEGLFHHLMNVGPTKGQEGEKFHIDGGVEKMGWAAAHQGAFEKAWFHGGDLKFIEPKEQGWNGVAFRIVNPYDGKEHVVKFARGAEDIDNLLKLKQLWQNKGYDYSGVDIPILSHSYNVFFNDKELNRDVNGGKNTWTVQIMNYVHKDVDFESILLRLVKNECWGPKRINGEIQQDSDGKDIYEIKQFNRDMDLRLLRFMGRAYGTFQRGGKDYDSINQQKRTFVHGDLFTGHVFIRDYTFYNRLLNTAEMAQPHFSLVDVATMRRVEDNNANMLLSDPMFLSTSMFHYYEHQRWCPTADMRKGTLDIFNNFYEGYVNVFSDATLQQLCKLYESPQSAYQAFLFVKNYQASLSDGGGNGMKTSQVYFPGVNGDPSRAEPLERDLANMHRLTFLRGYYKLKGMNTQLDSIMREQERWYPALFKK